MNTEKRVIGIVLICIGLILVGPFIPKFAILILGMYLIIRGIKLLSSDWNRF